MLNAEVVFSVKVGPVTFDVQRKDIWSINTDANIFLKRCLVRILKQNSISWNNSSRPNPNMDLNLQQIKYNVCNITNVL